MKQMTDDDLRAMVRQEIGDAISHIGGEISTDRQRALEYYMGEPFGNERDDRSSVVMTEVQDAIESVMPDMIEIFTGEQVVRFEPANEEDEEFAAQATDYVNFIWNTDNNGYSIIHDWIKDALIQRLGVIKIDWDSSEKTRKYSYTKLPWPELQRLQNEEGVTVLNHTLSDMDEERDQETAEPDDEDDMQPGRAPTETQGFPPRAPMEAPPGMPPQGGMQQPPGMPPMMPGVSAMAPVSALDSGMQYFDVEVERVTSYGRVDISPVPPEEFLIARRTVSLETAPFLCHRVRKTISDLIEEGFDPDELEDIPSHDEAEFSEERNSRFEDEDYSTNDSNDPQMREIWLYESYVRADVDGDGIAEWRLVRSAGSQYKLLSDPETGDTSVEVDDHPFVAITPIKMPHKLFGRSMADLVMDIQFIKSTVARQLLDNMYFANNGRNAVSKKVRLDDILTNRPGGAVRVNTDNADVAGHISPVQSAPLGGHAFPMLEWLDGMRETRTGVTRYNQGTDGASLNKTATGISQILGRAQKRIAFIARTFAETGFRAAYKRTLHLVVAHQDRARTIRIRNKWVEMDPRSWNADMDVVIQVGLSAASKETQYAMAMGIIQMQERVVQFQGGVDGPLVTLNNIYHALDKATSSAGFKDTGAFFSDPEDPKMIQAMQQKPPKPDPEMAKAQAELQMQQAKAQSDAQIAQQKAQSDAQLAQQKAQMDAMRSQSEMQMKQAEAQAEVELDRWKAEQDIALEQWKAQQAAEIAALKAGADARIRQEHHRHNMETEQ